MRNGLTAPRTQSTRDLSPGVIDGMCSHKGGVTLVDLQRYDVVLKVVQL